MSKRCSVCWKTNEEDALVCAHCGAKLSEEKVKTKIEVEKDHEVNEINQLSHHKEVSRIDSLDVVISTIFFVLLCVGFIVSIVTMIQYGIQMLLWFTTPFLVSLFIYYYLGMALVEHMKNGQTSRKELEIIRKLLEDKEKSVD